LLPPSGWLRTELPTPGGETDQTVSEPPPAIWSTSDDRRLAVIVVIGVDAHKKTHTLVAVDGNGRKLGEKTVETTDAGHAKALHWALLKFGDDDLTWGIEDCRHVSARLERSLIDAGQRVVRVGTRLMHKSRGSGRRPGKSDPIDAEAV
jgi:transposase